MRVISRSENEAARLVNLCGGDKRLGIVIGDIRETNTLEYALQDVDTVLHLAAMKHIDLCEQNPTEAIRTNVVATGELLSAFTGSTFIVMSTDKVAGASGCYGATKLLTEKLTLEFAKGCTDDGYGDRYMVVRSGNIFGSTGSVIPKWRDQIRQRNKITITHPGITRFFIYPSVLVDYIINTVEHGENGKVYIPEQVAVTLNDLATAVIETWGDKRTQIEVVGLREGEKMHERLYFPEEKNVVTTMKPETSDAVKVPRAAVDIITAWLKKWEDDK